MLANITCKITHSIQFTANAEKHQGFANLVFLNARNWLYWYANSRHSIRSQRDASENHSKEAEQDLSDVMLGMSQLILRWLFYSESADVTTLDLVLPLYVGAML